jgi:hypothetical protein
MSEKQYAERDAMDLDEAGGYYMRHLMAMTGENLHSKGDIAAELGWRDMKIAALQQKLDALAAENAALKDYLKECSVVQGEGNWTTDAEKSVYVPATEWMPQTPVTDTYLNSVRAEGVEAAIEEILQTLSSNHETILKELAAKLRAGKDGE